MGFPVKSQLENHYHKSSQLASYAMWPSIHLAIHTRPSAYENLKFICTKNYRTHKKRSMEVYSRHECELRAIFGAKKTFFRQIRDLALTLVVDDGRVSKIESKWNKYIIMWCVVRIRTQWVTHTAPHWVTGTKNIWLYHPKCETKKKLGKHREGAIGKKVQKTLTHILRMIVCSCVCDVCL